MRAGVGALLALGACALGGCSFGGDEVAQRVQQPTVLSAAAVEREPAGSPARGLLEWWREMQFADFGAGARRYAAPRPAPRQLERQVGLAFGAFGSRPLVTGVKVRGDRATAAVLLETRTRAPNGRVDVVRLPASFELVHDRDGWLLADNRYLERAVRARKALAQALRDQQRAAQP